jgi:hypothetical protein
MNTEVDPLLLLRAAHEGHSPKDFAEKIGCSRQHLDAVLNGKKRPGPVILRFLGLRRRYSYTRATRE